MIQFNITLLFQAVNFIITLLVMRRFFFLPLIERIIERRREEKQLRDEIVLKRKDVENFRTEKTAQLSQFQKDAKTDFPFIPVTKPAQALETAPATVDMPSNKQIEDITRELEERIRHGN